MMSGVGLELPCINRVDHQCVRWTKSIEAWLAHITEPPTFFLYDVQKRVWQNYVDFRIKDQEFISRLKNWSM